MKFSSDALIWCMATERGCNDRSGIYGFTQRSLAYHSNKIEGSTLTEDQTAALFEEGFLPASQEVYRANGYAIGEYKRRTNIVNNLNTTHPKDVAEKMRELMDWYHGVENKSLETIAMLHAAYELIHPFQDGNGRTGRIIMFRECLAYDICPFIVQDKNRAVYVTSLKKAQTEDDYSELVKYFEAEQAEYFERCQYFSVEDRYLECVHKEDSYDG